jgi:hypothetical protein
MIGRRSRGGFGLGLLLLVAALIGGGALAGGVSDVEAQQYSVYSDPEKPAISLVLSDEQNGEEFQTYFALSDEEIESVLAAVREENEALSRAQTESSRVLGSSRSLPKEQVQGKVRASGYDEKVREAVARTKAAVKRVLPADRRPELQAWVDAEWQQERQEAEDLQATDQASTAAVRWYKVFATQYEGYNNYEVALPHEYLKFKGGYRVILSRGGQQASAPVKEVGPWNIHDNWWDKSRYRTKFKNLPRGLPEAEAAYYDGYNNGRDQFGRKVLNPAGVDLTPAVAKKLGLRKYENAWIWVSYPR